MQTEAGDIFRVYLYLYRTYNRITISRCRVCLPRHAGSSGVFVCFQSVTVLKFAYMNNLIIMNNYWTCIRALSYHLLLLQPWLQLPFSRVGVNELCLVIVHLSYLYDTGDTFNQKVHYRISPCLHTEYLPP